MTMFKDRQDAGRQLVEALAAMQREDELDLDNAVVMALPRGGVPVGYEIATMLKLPLDVCVVRKVGSPLQPELAVAAVTEDGEMVVNEGICESLGLSPGELEELALPKRREVIDRIRQFRGTRPMVDVRGKTVILVDDGLATGATALSAIQALKKKKAAKIVLAVPVCPKQSVGKFRAEADEFVVLATPANFQAVGQFYRDFSQTTDQEVRELLEQTIDETSINGIH